MIPRILHTVLAAAVFAAATLPCGFGVPGSERLDRPVAAESEDQEGHAATAHADAGHGDMPCHAAAPEPPPHELTQPCPCGCGDRPASGASLSRLPLALLPSEPEAAPRARSPRPPLPEFQALRGFAAPPDVVPWV